MRNGFLLFGLVCAACGHFDLTPDGGPDAMLPPDAGPDAAGATDGVPAPDALGVVGCPAIDGTGNGPTTHGGLIRVSETWTAAGSPHLVTSPVTLMGATVTIEPCAEIQLGSGMDIDAMGDASSLVALGTAAKPIKFHGQGGATWGKIYASYPGTVSLANVTIDGGGDPAFYGASLVGEGNGQEPFKEVLSVDHVTVQNSFGLGVLVRYDGAFKAGSQNLTITGSGVSDHGNGYAMRIGIGPAGGLPSGTYTGNFKDRILLDGGNVSTSFTLKKAGVPYEVQAGPDVYLQTGAVMTIAAGVTMSLPSNSTINVSWQATGGGLVAQGTASDPILLTRSGSDPWGAIVVLSMGSATLTNLTLDGGGGTATNNFYHGASLVLSSTGVPPLVKSVKAINVTVQESSGAGVAVSAYAAFTDDSSGLTVKQSGNGTDPYPVRIATPAVGSLPSGTYTGNMVDEIFVDPSEAITDSDAFHARGVPYHMPPGFRAIPADANHTAIVTIDAGTTLRFEKTAAMTFGSSNLTTVDPAVLVANGTAQKPIVFTSAAPAPAAGDWVALIFNGSPASGNSIQFARFEYAGGVCLACVAFSCSADEDAAVVIGQRPNTAFIQSSTFANIAGNGVLSGWSSDLDGPDFKPGNTFTNVSGCDQTLWRDSGLGCPNPNPMCF